MRPYGLREYVGLHRVCEKYPDAQDLAEMGRKKAHNKKTRQLQKKDGAERIEAQ